MSIARDMTNEEWKHSAPEERIEELCVQAPGMTERRLSQLALRFISAKGLSAEFADALEEVIRAEEEAPSP